MRTQISIHDHAAVDALIRRLRIDPYHLRRLRSAFYRKQQPVEKALTILTPEQASAVQEAVDFHPLKLQRRVDSQIDGASKLLFQTHDGHLIETVILRIATGRTALCVSVQAGCAAACAFCATGKLGLARNLTHAEILDQVIQAGQLLRGEERTIRNLVFMGMGEPFHNETNLYATLNTLRSNDGFAMGDARLLVSTVGVPAAMQRFVAEFPKVRLALSLHSARAKQRPQLVPLAKKYSLTELKAALQHINQQQGQSVMIEYTLLQGLNDTNEDLAALSDYLSGLDVHLNLIPYNPIPSAPDLVGTAPERRTEFANALKAQGFKVTIRYSLGADIAAACGTLAAQ